MQDLTLISITISYILLSEIKGSVRKERLRLMKQINKEMERAIMLQGKIKVLDEDNKDEGRISNLEIKKAQNN